MDEKGFERQLRAEGFDVLTREVEPGSALDEHDHDWDVKGLVLRGAFLIETGGESHAYAAGQSFELAAGVPHSESSGSEGALLLLGRRSRAR